MDAACLDSLESVIVEALGRLLGLTGCRESSGCGSWRRFIAGDDTLRKMAEVRDGLRLLASRRSERQMKAACVWKSLRLARFCVDHHAHEVQYCCFTVLEDHGYFYSNDHVLLFTEDRKYRNSP
jgi:hypothetical protein